jgi:hypothetical protein
LLAGIFFMIETLNACEEEKKKKKTRREDC